MKKVTWAAVAQSETTDKISKKFYQGDVEIRTPGIIVRADERSST